MQGRDWITYRDLVVVEELGPIIEVPVLRVKMDLEGRRLVLVVLKQALRFASPTMAWREGRSREGGCTPMQSEGGPEVPSVYSRREFIDTVSTT